MSKIVLVEGIWYPPVVSDHNGANVALLPSLVDSEMYVQAVYECQISGTDPEGVTLQVSGVGLPCSRKDLTWYNPTLEPLGITVTSIHAVLPSGIQVTLEPERLIRYEGVDQNISAFLSPLIQKSIPHLFGRIWQTQDVYDPAMKTNLQMDFELEEPIQVPIDDKDQSIGVLRLGLLVQLTFTPR
jgi:hypothetical protein